MSSAHFEDRLPFHELETETFDYVIVGTGIISALRAALLSQQGNKVLVVSKEAEYGAPYFQDFNPVAPLPIHSGGALVELLIQTGAYKYLQFEPISSIAIYEDGELRTVPLSKEALMNDQRTSLVEKRLLMRAMSNANINGLSYKLKDLLSSMLGFPDDEFLEEELKIFVNGIGKFLSAERVDRCAIKPVPFAPCLVPINGSGEVVQALCRSAAVSGAVFVLNQKDLEICDGYVRSESNGWRVNCNNILQEQYQCQDVLRWKTTSSNSILYRLKETRTTILHSNGFYYAWGQDLTQLSRFLDEHLPFVIKDSQASSFSPILRESDFRGLLPEAG